MTSTEQYRPRHAATPGPRPVDTPTMVLSAVIPSQRPAPERPGHPVPTPSRPAVAPARRSAAVPVPHPVAVPAPRPAAHPPYVAAVPPQHVAPVPVLPAHPAPPLAYAPPAGLPVGHEPIRRRSTGPVLVAAATAFVVVTGAVVAIGNLARDASAVAGQSDTSTRSTSQQIADWRDDGGLSRMQAIQGDLESIGGAGHDPAAMNSACRSLQRDVESAQAYRPVPDAQVQTSWAGALAHGARAATYCIDGTDQRDGALLSNSASELTEMARDLDDGAARLGTIMS